MAKPPYPSDYSLGEKSAAALYGDLSHGERDQVIEKARSIASISLPSAFPPEGYRTGDNLRPPNQSINARCLVNLASRIMLTALPAGGLPAMKYTIIEHKMQKAIDADPDLYAETKLALGRRAIAHTERIEDTQTRTALSEGAMQLLLAGNVCWNGLSLDWPTVHRMDSYVVQRNTRGQQLLVILEQVVNLLDQDPHTRSFIENVRMSQAAAPTTSDQITGRTESGYGEEVVVHCVCKLLVRGRHKSDKVWLYWEEFKGHVIPGTEVSAPFDAPPLYAAWMVPNYGSNWGNSYCSLYEGDMWKVENQESNLSDGADAAAMTWLFVDPAGLTSKKVLEKAMNMKVMHGRAQDISVFRLEKFNDFTFVQSNTDNAVKRLMQAFLMASSIQRPGDRVTAEEWRIMSRELNEAMGGLYASLAQGFIKAVILRAIQLHKEEDHELKELPEGIVRVGVITGIDSIGLDVDQANLEAAMTVISKLVPEQVLATEINPKNFITRTMSGYSVKPDGLVNTKEQSAQIVNDAKQTAAQQTLLDRTAQPIAKAGADAIAPAIVEQMMGGAAQPPQQG